MLMPSRYGPRSIGTTTHRTLAPSVSELFGRKLCTSYRKHWSCVATMGWGIYTKLLRICPQERGLYWTLRLYMATLDSLFNQGLM